MDLSHFLPLLQQQQAMYAVNAHQATLFAAMHAAHQQQQQAQQAQQLAMAQQARSALQAERSALKAEIAAEKEAKAAAAAAAAASTPAAGSSSSSTGAPSPSPSPVPSTTSSNNAVEEQAPPPEPVPSVSMTSPASVALIQSLESEWRWGAVCLFFEHFLPLFPLAKRVVPQFRPELLMQSFLCEHHSCVKHDWLSCSCPHPACQHLAALLAQLMLMIHPIPPNCKKLPKNQLGTHNYLPRVQSILEKAYFAPNQTGHTEAIQEIMQIYMDEMSARKDAERDRLAAEAEAEAASREQEQKNSSGDGVVKQESDTSAKPASASSTTIKLSLHLAPPGSALLASHVHALPALCKLYLLHFLTEHVVSEVDLIKEYCTHQQNLMHSQSNAEAAAAILHPDGAGNMVPLPPLLSAPSSYNSKYSSSLSIPHGVSDDPAQSFWVFLHEESGRIHLYSDTHEGAEDEFHVVYKPVGAAGPRRKPKVHGNESEEERWEAAESKQQEATWGEHDANGKKDIHSDSDDYEEEDEDTEMEPLDSAHAPPSFKFTLLASEVGAVQDLVHTWSRTWTSPLSLEFLRKLTSDLIPQAILHGKKAERMSRREKVGRPLAYSSGEYLAQRSQRQKPRVNYAELAEGDDTSTHEEEANTQAALAQSRHSIIGTRSSLAANGGGGSGSGSGGAHRSSSSAAAVNAAAVYTSFLQNAAAASGTPQDLMQLMIMTQYNQQQQQMALNQAQMTPTLASVAAPSALTFLPSPAADPTPIPTTAAAAHSAAPAAAHASSPAPASAVAPLALPPDADAVHAAALAATQAGNTAPAAAAVTSMLPTAMSPAPAAAESDAAPPAVTLPASS